MNIQLLAADRLSAVQIEHWSHLQAANPDLQSPFFHPLYTREAAAVLPHVEVAIIEDGGEPMAYFPFQRSRGNVGIPVGGSLNDFQGIVARPGFTFDAAALVRGCRLAGLRFTQLLASQQPFQAYHWLAERFALDGSPRGVRRLLPPPPRGGQQAHFASRPQATACGA